jgi:hypothetical protein
MEYRNDPRGTKLRPATVHDGQPELVHELDLVGRPVTDH